MGLFVNFFLIVLEDIGNTLIEYIRTYTLKANIGLATHAHIFVEVEISKVLFDKEKNQLDIYFGL
jgi:hypothetical protein